LSPELKTPLQLKEIQPLQQNNHQPQVKLLFSSPTTRMLTAPTRAFTRGLHLASQQAALLQFVSSPLQTGLERFLLILVLVAILSKPSSSAKRSPLLHGTFTILTSSSHHLEKEFAESANSHLQVVFPLEEKQELERVGSERILIPNC